MFILKTNMAEKRSMEKQLLLTGSLNTLVPVDSSAETSIAYKLVTLLIKRGNFLSNSQNQYEYLF